MTFAWTQHRFSGGALALDVANSVILRFDAKRRIDRYADPVATGRLCRSRQPLFRRKTSVRDAGARDARKPRCVSGFCARQPTGIFVRLFWVPPLATAWADLLDAASVIIRRHKASTAPLDGAPLDAATARSALMLAASGEPERLKICPNCQWLFLDRSRNRSRTWCDMTVCGNRAKASRHYQRQKKELTA